MRRTLLRAFAVALFLFTTLNPTASADYDPSWEPNFASSPYTGGTDLDVIVGYYIDVDTIDVMQ